MIKVDLYYAVCQYVPDEIRSESINVGLVIHIPNEKYEYSKFIHIKNRKRLYAFDDDYDADYINLIFNHMKHQFNFGYISDCDNCGVNEFENIHSTRFLEEKIKYYVNEFRFLPIQRLEIDSSEIKDIVNDLERTYLYYDIPKGERITRPEVQKLLKKEVKNLKLSQYMSKENILVDFDNNPVFDFSYDDTYVRTFSFDYSLQSNLTKEVKLFMFDIQNNVEQLRGKNVVVVLNQNYDSTDAQINNYLEMFKELSDNNDFNIIIKTLPQYATYLLRNGLKA